MRSMHKARLARWPVMLAVAAAGLAGTGLAAAPASAAAGGSSAAASPSPRPSPSPSPRAAATPASASPGGVCSVTPDGHLVNCPKPVPKAKMPAGARNTTILTQPVSNLAQLVDTRTWTSGGGNTFPGADVPFGMTQWSPDTEPNRSDGGGYNFGDTKLTGYALTHISGPGCGAAGDVPILPMTGALPPGNPDTVTTAFGNTGEVAQAGFYSAQSNQPSTITSEFTATDRTSMGRFTFPATSQADFLVKLMDSENGDFGDSAKIVNNHEIVGSDTSGHFCGETNNDGQPQLYTVYFDIVFDHPFTRGQIITEPGESDPAAVFLTFDTTSDQVIQAKVGTSYVSTANAALDVQTESPGWDFGSIKSAAQQTWNNLLGEVQVSGGTYAVTQEFYSLLYKDFMQPNIVSDVNGQFMGSDLKVHTVATGQQAQYGTYSGWDTYHSLSQLQAMLDPTVGGQEAQSLINYYSEDQILQQWGYMNLNNYVMVGDPAQSIIADLYAFGSRNFDTSTALKDMLTQATTVNDVRPGEALEERYGYLPEDGAYGCCNPHGYVPTLLENDSEDLAIAQFASALGDSEDAAMLEQRANNWENVFDGTDNLLNPRNENGQFVPGITPTTSDHYVEGDAYEYLWNVPNDYSALFSLLGGPSKVAPVVRTYLSKPNGFGMYAQLTNEFDFGEQYMGDYAQDPAGTQQAVSNIRNTMYPPGPSLDNNDDLGANSSTFIWEMLGMYPENSGSGNLVFNGPGFPHAAINLANGKTITINAPGASPTEYYVHNLKINGSPYSKLYVPFSTLSQGATLDWTLGTTPSTWGNAPADAPPSYTAGLRPVVGYLSSQQATVAPGGSTMVTLGLRNATGSAQTVQASVSPPSGSGITVSESPSSGTVQVPPNGTANITLTVTASSSAQQNFYTVPIKLTSAGTTLPGLNLTVLVAQPGSLLAAFNNAGISDDSDVSEANFDNDGNSYSAEALASAGLKPGQPFTTGGITYTWPVPAPGYPDNVIASGQKVTVNAPAGTQQVGFVGSATGGPSQGTITLNYSDGSTAKYWLGLSDWTLNAGRSQPSFGNQIVATMAYRNCAGCSGGRDNTKTYVFAVTLPVNSVKTLASVTLPTGANRGELHVFAIGTTTTAISGAVINSLSPATASAGQVVTINGSGFGTTQGNGYVAFSDNGTTWDAPGSNSLTIDSWSDTQITFSVPSGSGSVHVWPGTPASVTVLNNSGQMSNSAELDITPTSNPADYYDNAGISPDSNQACANYDGDGYSYSADALANTGLNPGATVNADNHTFTWPNVPACSLDNILAAGQTMLVKGASGASTLGLLGSSTNGSSQGTITINYTDGTSSTQTLSFTDWAQSPGPEDTIVATMPYRNSIGGTSQSITMYVFATTVPVDSSKTVASITFPAISNYVGSPDYPTAMHIFALSEG
jgi:predicted alpha-1,2-mannosidase